jgi:hypothetical protein
MTDRNAGGRSDVAMKEDVREVRCIEAMVYIEAA